jgi:hypothetical protein|tara:strand:- start:1048 stop:1197 length:150 start_codon:yes stop_codon:yes gene_type:complete
LRENCFALDRVSLLRPRSVYSPTLGTSSLLRFDCQPFRLNARRLFFLEL